MLPIQVKDEKEEKIEKECIFGRQWKSSMLRG